MLRVLSLTILIRYLSQCSGDITASAGFLAPTISLDNDDSSSEEAHDGFDGGEMPGRHAYDESASDQAQEAAHVFTVLHAKKRHRLNQTSTTRDVNIVNEDIVVRPHKKENVPELIKFALFPKAFYGIDLKGNSFTLDLVMVLEWKDERVAKLIPNNTDSLTMNDKLAITQMWMPEVDVTNRDIRKLEVISSSVKILKDGTVNKVERVGVVVKNKYDISEFPFDIQVLETKIASTKLMLQDCQLVPMSEDLELKDSLLEGEPYILVKATNSAFEDIDGALKKSRGVLKITVARDLGKYGQTFLVPACLYVMISWAVFWLPFKDKFMNPRMSLAILTLLSLVFLAIKTETQLPQGAPYNWHDLFVQDLQAIMFSTLLFNVLASVAKFTLECDKAATAMNLEVRYMAPVVSVLTVVIIFAYHGEGSLLTLVTTTVLTNFIIFCWMIVYTAFNFVRIFREYRVKFPEG